MATRKKTVQARDGRTNEVRALRGERLRSLRESLGWSQQQLAFRAALTSRQPSGFESGKADPSLATFVRIVRALDCDPRYLLGMSDKP